MDFSLYEVMEYKGRYFLRMSDPIPAFSASFREISQSRLEKQAQLPDDIGL
jgi:hypothetical protein